MRVKGGGHTSQVYAIRQAIAKALVAYYAKYIDAYSAMELKKKLVAYDRTLLIADPRRMEPKKFGGHGARARRQKRCVSFKSSQISECSLLRFFFVQLPLSGYIFVFHTLHYHVPYSICPCYLCKLYEHAICRKQMRKYVLQAVTSNSRVWKVSKNFWNLDEHSSAFVVPQGVVRKLVEWSESRANCKEC